MYRDDSAEIDERLIPISDFRVMPSSLLKVPFAPFPTLLPIPLPSFAAQPLLALPVIN